jgi:hypothetical protein
MILELPPMELPIRGILGSQRITAFYNRTTRRIVIEQITFINVKDIECALNLWHTSATKVSIFQIRPCCIIPAGSELTVKLQITLKSNESIEIESSLDSRVHYSFEGREFHE